MSLLHLILSIHWITVLSLTVFSFVIGFIWHSPFLFGKTWKQENNPDSKPIKINAPLIFGGTALAHLVAISSLSLIVSGLGGLNGFKSGFLISIVWVLPAILGTYLFANRSLKLLAIDAGMYIVLFSVSGFVLGIW